MVKISIVGVGRVGSELAYSLVKNPKVDEILLVDIIKSKVEGTILDISHAYPEFSYKLKPGELADTEGSKIIVLAAGLPRTQKIKTRMELLSANKKIIEDIMKSITFSEDTLTIVTTNPVEPLTYLVQKLSGLNSKNIIGFSNVLDSKRLEYIISKKIRPRPTKIKSLVIGEHGENMIPVFSQCFIDDKPIFDYNLNFEEISDELKKSSKAILDTIGFTQFGPASHIERLIDSILNNSNEVFSVSSYFDRNEHYGIEDVCISLPVKINSNGISSVEHYELTDDEKQKLSKLASELKKIQEAVVL